MNDYTRRSPKRRGAKWVTEAVYGYCDDTGRTVFEVHRRVSQFGTHQPDINDKTGKPRKQFFQRWLMTSDGKKPPNAPVLLYRLPELIAAVKHGQTVYVVEGEKKVEALAHWGVVATCCAEGALSHAWKPEHAAFLRGAEVVIVPDNDEPGRKHADCIGRSLEGVAKSVRLLELRDLPERGDIVDWQQAGGTRDQFLELAMKAPPWQPSDQLNSESRAVIRLETGMLHQQADEAEAALVAAGAQIYTQGGRLVRMVVEKADAARGRKTLVARIVQCDRPCLTRELSKTVRFVKLRQAKGVSVEVVEDVPRSLAEAVLFSASSQFSELAGIIETQTLRPDGTILAEPGYDAPTGLLLVNPPPMPDIAERASKSDAEAALRTLADLLSEFPFSDEPSRSVALSALITPVVRGALACAPLHVATAPVAGSGKSYLFDTAAAIATGKPCPVLSAGASNEETEKRLHGAALSGQPLISIDNLNGVLRGDFVCQMTTQPLVEVRRLGSTGNIQIQNRATVFANGNNMEIEGDLVRRSVCCRLNPQMENPETRQFRGNPFKKVLDDRGRYVAAALTLVRAHVIAGAPGDDLSPLSGFADWSRLVRGALVWLGCADPVATQEGLRAEDPAVAALDAVLETWADCLNDGTLPDEPLTVRRLLGQNCYQFGQQLRMATHTHGNDTLSEVRVGKFLTRHKERIRKGLKLVSEVNTRNKQQRWQLVGWRDFIKATREADKVVAWPKTSTKHRY